MKRDGRTLDGASLETIRLMAIERVREGEAPAEVMASFGFNRTTIYKWLKAALQPGVGIKALRSTKATGRPRTLTAAQERQVFRWVNGRDPRQYGLDFGLWTRKVVAELIAQKFGVTLAVTAVGELLAKLGLTPQKPLQRAYQRDPEAIERWQRETFPAIARQARAEGAAVYFWDESGFRADTVHGKTWGVRGQTPVVHRPGQRQSISAASAVTANGAFWFCTHDGALKAERFGAAAAQADARSQEARASGARQSARAQDRGGTRLRRFDERPTDAALPARVCTRLEPGRTGVESCQAHRRSTTPAPRGRNPARQDRTTTGATQTHATPRSVLLSCTFCRLY